MRRAPLFALALVAGASAAVPALPSPSTGRTAAAAAAVPVSRKHGIQRSSADRAFAVGAGGGISSRSDDRISSSIISREGDSRGSSNRQLVAALSRGGGNIAPVTQLLQFVLCYAPLVLVLGGLNFACPHLLKDLLHCWPRLAAGGLVVSLALVILAVPQACRLSGGVLPMAGMLDIAAILLKALPTQTMFKTVQYFSLRSIKFALDGVSWMPYKTLNTIVSYGLTATVMQCAAYNNAIMHTYNHYGVGEAAKRKAAKKGKKAAAKASGEPTPSKSVVTMFARFLHANVMPGIYFSFVRECGATGAGIVVAPKVRAALAPVIGNWNPIPAKIISGIIGGMFCSLMTQWLHNNSLRAGNIYQYTGDLPSTLEVLDMTWKELGFRMFYLNADRRVLSTATATTALTVIDIFA